VLLTNTFQNVCQVVSLKIHTRQLLMLIQFIQDSAAQGLRFLWQWRWRLLSSGMWHCVVNFYYI